MNEIMHLQRPYLLEVLVLLILNEITDFSRSDAGFTIEESRRAVTLEKIRRMDVMRMKPGALMKIRERIELLTTSTCRPSSSRMKTPCRLSIRRGNVHMMMLEVTTHH